MDENVKAKWLEALRSGEYEQGQGQLRYGNRFCCLGVLCEVAVKEGLPIEVRKSMYDTTFYNDEGFVLPDSVREWAGLDHYNPEVPWSENGEPFSLGGLNDAGKNFEFIAALIESNL
jgi:hypothetical protein